MLGLSPQMLLVLVWPYSMILRAFVDAFGYISCRRPAPSSWLSGPGRAMSVELRQRMERAVLACGVGCSSGSTAVTSGPGYVNRKLLLYLYFLCVSYGL